MPFFHMDTKFDVCPYCGRDCYAPVPESAPEVARQSLGKFVATCAEGQRSDAEDTCGWCYNTVVQAVLSEPAQVFFAAILWEYEQSATPIKLSEIIIRYGVEASQSKALFIECWKNGLLGVVTPSL